MRIQKYPKIRRFIAMLGLILIFGLLIAMIAVLLGGHNPGLAIGLFACIGLVSISTYVFLMYLQKYMDKDGEAD